MNIDANMTGGKLVEVHNDLIDRTGGGTKLTVWKGKKDVLIGRIQELAKMVEPAALKKVKAEKTAKADGPTVRSVALELLCHVDYYEGRDVASGDDNRVEGNVKSARSVGLPYDVIISRIQQRFPDCNTTVACLRWYAVKVRAEEHGYEGLRLPQRRPRVKPAK